MNWATADDDRGHRGTTFMGQAFLSLPVKFLMMMIMMCLAGIEDI